MDKLEYLEYKDEFKHLMKKDEQVMKNFWLYQYSQN